VKKLVSQAGIGALIFALAAISIPMLSHGQTVSNQACVQPVAAISFTTAVMQTNEAKRDFGLLQAKFAPRQTQIESLSREIDGLRKQLGETNENLSDSERNARTQTLNAKQKQLERAEEDFRNDSQSEAQEAFQRIAQKVNNVLQSYAQKHGYTVVLDRGSGDTAPILLYAIDSIDITRQLTSEYDAQSGIQAPGQNGITGNGAQHSRPTEAPKNQPHP
jgi:outer membrane protein